MALRLSHPFSDPPPCRLSFSKLPIRRFSFSVHCSLAATDESQKLVLEVKDRLERYHETLPVGKNGRDDEDMILWFLKDRDYSVEEATERLAKAIKWREDFGVSELTEESVRNVAESGKAFVHDLLDVNDRPVLIVVASNHYPGMYDRSEDEKLCVFLVEKALSKLPAGQERILGIFDLRGFGTENADLKFLTFVFDIFYYYYPKRLSQVLFVEAPFIFKQLWKITKPLLGSHASLVRFCSVQTVREEYFTENTVPTIFKH
uniref:CRAL-TRIO domain-containing protein n=1 Tax=Kalanchoe fedtschenkoi TaxID=63787 RepID=A0A7N0VET8_KALFE